MSLQARANDDEVASAERRYRALLEHMSEGFVVCDAVRDGGGRLVDYWILDANPIYLERVPGGGAVVGRRQLEQRPATPPEWFEVCDRALAGQPVRFEFCDPLNGRWYEAHMMRLSDTEFGQLFVDVSDRKRAEQRQAELFDELNHRVKNNLSVISAILALQARAAPCDVRDQLERARDRIAAIADLHTALYQQESARDVGVCQYLQDLVERLTRALDGHGRFRIESECDDVKLPVADAVSVGLIVNELVTNAAKYAFGPEAEGRVRVELREAEGWIRLTVCDDGCGAPPNAFSTRAGLGSRIVQALASGLGGAVRRIDRPGTSIEIAFPAP
jgi:two-component sensor histidine kinase